MALIQNGAVMKERRWCVSKRVVRAQEGGACPRGWCSQFAKLLIVEVVEKGVILPNNGANS
jgi:hypothetical protein